MQDNEKTEIYIVAHKQFPAPGLAGYFPLQVGFAETDFPGFLRDNTGDNIAEKNRSYCELTALYWIWKNSDADISGLVHYRRFLSNGQKVRSGADPGEKQTKILSLQQIEKDLETVDVILPKRHHYLTETAETHYIHNHHREGLSLATEAVKELYPSYAEAWEAALMSRSSHLFNIFICRKPVLDGYCKWLFDILSYVENRLDITGYSDSEKRVYGYLGELLLDAYVNHRGLSCREYPVLYMEKQNFFAHYKTSLLGKLGLSNPNR